jgi:cyclophilin family peptidyl-prolyl cis-trans isomerase
MKLYKLMVILLVVSSCSIFKGKGPKTKTVWVDSEQVACADDKQCLNVYIGKELKEEWTLLSTEIKGFEFEKGYRYQLNVVESKVEDPKEGESKVAYKLTEVVAKTPVLKEDGIYAYIQTNVGDIVGRLYMDRAPLTVANFVGLAEGTLANTARPLGIPYFDSLIFHRVIPNFMVQGGDPTGTGSGGPGYKFKNEIHPELSHSKAGIFSMANSGPNTNGSQFFITHGPTPHLDGAYNVFGEVVMGQNIITLMGGVPKNRNNKPNSPIIMNKVSILRIGDAAKKFDANETFTKLK